MGWTAMLHGGLSGMVKTVKDHVATKTSFNGPEQH
jgi:hypothetical protein